MIAGCSPLMRPNDHDQGHEGGPFRPEAGRSVHWTGSFEVTLRRRFVGSMNIIGSDDLDAC